LADAHHGRARPLAAVYGAISSWPRLWAAELAGAAIAVLLDRAWAARRTRPVTA